MARLFKANLSNIITNLPKKTYTTKTSPVKAIVNHINNTKIDYSNINYEKVVKEALGLDKYENAGKNVSIFDYNLTQDTASDSGQYTDYDNYSVYNYPKGNSRSAGKARAVVVAKYLVKEGGFTKEQAAAMAAVYLDENNCDPGDIMQAEKRANVNSYGAGIASWTDQTEKNKVLRDAGLPAGTPIESLTLQQQCDMVIASSNGTYRTYYNALKRCDTLEDASATAVCITGGVGFSNNWSTHPTQADAHRLSEWYGTRNDNKYGYSSYHHNLDQRRLDYAREIYAEL